MSKGKVIEYGVFHDNSPGADGPLDIQYQDGRWVDSALALKVLPASHDP